MKNAKAAAVLTRFAYMKKKSRPVFSKNVPAFVLSFFSVKKLLKPLIKF